MSTPEDETKPQEVDAPQWTTSPPQPSAVTLAPPPQPMTSQPQQQYMTSSIPKESNPCCCCPLQGGVLCASICGIIWYAFNFFLGIWLLVVTINKKEELVTPILSAVSAVAGLIFTVLLTVGAVRRHAVLVKVAFGGYILLFLITLAAEALSLVDVFRTNYYYVGDTRHKRSSDESLSLKIILGLAIVITVALFIYVIFVIWTYAQQLTRTGGQVGGGGAGQFPVGRQNYYQPASPNVGYSQMSMGQGQGYPQPVTQGYPQPVALTITPASN